MGRSYFHKTTLKHKGTVFSIDTRGQVLSSQLEAPIIVPHTASKTRVNIYDTYMTITCVASAFNLESMFSKLIL